MAQIGLGQKELLGLVGDWQGSETRQSRQKLMAWSVGGIIFVLLKIDPELVRIAGIGAFKGAHALRYLILILLAVLSWWMTIFLIYIWSDHIDRERKRRFFEDILSEWRSRRNLLNQAPPSRLDANERYELEDLNQALAFIDKNMDIVHPRGMRSWLRFSVDIVAPVAIFAVAALLLLYRLVTG
ncbi:MAG: hypothetical protein AB7E70_07225 [Hyphomicrobiaceae bacterium]